MISSFHNIDWFLIFSFSVLGMIGRIMYLYGNKREMKNSTFIENFFISIGMGLCGGGLGEWLAKGTIVSFAIAIVAGLLGPNFLYRFAGDAIASKLKVGKEDKP